MMKKIVALIAALVLCLSCTVAFAATPVIGEPFTFEIGTFQSVFNMLAENMGLVYVWEDAPRSTYGYSMYVAMNETGSVAISMHENSGVFAFEVDTVVGADADGAAAEKVGEEFGTAMTLITMAAYICEHGNLDQEAVSSIEQGLYGIVALIEQLDNADEAALRNGMSYVVDVAGYPSCTQLSLQDTANGGQQLWFAYMLLSPTGSFAE